MTQSVDERIEQQLKSLKEKSSCSTDSCFGAAVVAACDKKVQTIFLEKIDEGHIPTGVHCEPGGFERTRVVFGFRCGDGKVCIIPPTFSATVDLIINEVIAIDDPYVPRTASMSQLTASGTFVGNG